MAGLVPYPLKIGAIEGLAERCTHGLKEGAAALERLRGELLAGGDVGGILKKASSHIAKISEIEVYGLSPLQCQTKEMAQLNVVLRGLHSEMALPFPRPTVCCISNQGYASHIPTNTIYVPIGESKSIQYFAHLYHELGHYLLYAMDDPRLEPLREGFGRASAIVGAHYAGLAQDKAREHAPAHVTDFIGWTRTRWQEWMQESFCDLFGVLGGGPASAWAYLYTVAKNAMSVYHLNAFTVQTHPPSDARMTMMCAGLRLAGCGEDADAIWAKWRDVADTVGGSPGEMYRYAAPDGPMRSAARAIHEALGETGVVTYDPGSRGPEGGRMRALLNDAWSVFWRSEEGEYQKWEAAELERLNGWDSQ